MANCLDKRGGGSSRGGLAGARKALGPDYAVGATFPPAASTKKIRESGQTADGRSDRQLHRLTRQNRQLHRLTRR